MTGRRAALAFALVAITAVAGCGSAGAPGGSPTPHATAVTITRVQPKDAGSEPPWNGIYVQVNATAPSPAAMAGDDWSVSVNGEKQALLKPPDVHPYAADAVTVVFILKNAAGSFGTYRFRVVYAPDGGPRVQRAWEFDWAPGE